MKIFQSYLPQERHDEPRLAILVTIGPVGNRPQHLANEVVFSGSSCLLDPPRGTRVINQQGIDRQHPEQRGIIALLG